LLKLSEGRLLGRFFASSRQRLRDVAGPLGVHHLDNLAPLSGRLRRPSAKVVLDRRAGFAPTAFVPRRHSSPVCPARDAPWLYGYVSGADHCSDMSADGTTVNERADGWSSCPVRAFSA
jgi:hypothetical protein